MCSSCTMRRKRTSCFVTSLSLWNTHAHTHWKGLVRAVQKRSHRSHHHRNTRSFLINFPTHFVYSMSRWSRLCSLQLRYLLLSPCLV
jgi:hypothetical protein